MNVIGYTEGGMIRVVIDGSESLVPDDMTNGHRQEIARWELDGNVIPPYFKSVVIPSQISDRQFFQQLALDGHITEDEALDAVGPGIIPSAMLSLIEQLPQEDQFTAKMLIRGATTFERLHPVTMLIQQLYHWDDAERDAFWTAAYGL